MWALRHQHDEIVSDFSFLGWTITFVYINCPDYQLCMHICNHNVILPKVICSVQRSLHPQGLQLRLVSVCSDRIKTPLWLFWGNTETHWWPLCVPWNVWHIPLIPSAPAAGCLKSGSRRQEMQGLIGMEGKIRNDKKEMRNKGGDSWWMSCNKACAVTCMLLGHLADCWCSCLSH